MIAGMQYNSTYSTKIFRIVQDLVGKREDLQKKQKGKMLFFLTFIRWNSMEEKHGYPKTDSKYTTKAYFLGGYGSLHLRGFSLPGCDFSSMPVPSQRGYWENSAERGYGSFFTRLFTKFERLWKFFKKRIFYHKQGLPNFDNTIFTKCTFPNESINTTHGFLRH